MDVRLSSNDNSRFRLNRLNRVLGCSIGIHNKIISLHDERGTLTVVSNCELTPDEQQVFRTAWGSVLCSESPDYVIFEVMS